MMRGIRRAAAPGLLAFALLACAAADAQTILNSEALQPEDVENFFFRVEASANVTGGNSRVTDVQTNGAVGYRGAHDWLVFMGGFSYLSTAGDVSVDDRFAQLRYSRLLSKRTRTFHFVQEQRSLSQLLARRVLVGSGIRHSFVETDTARLELGVGAMWEDETLHGATLPPTAETHSRDFRADLIGVGAHRLSATTRFVDVLYLEPRIDDPGDDRLFDESRIELSVTKGIQLSVALRWRDDSRPPPTVRRSDLELVTSVSALVR